MQWIMASASLTQSHQQSESACSLQDGVQSGWLAAGTAADADARGVER
jgi:hypothetical protein